MSRARVFTLPLADVVSSGRLLQAKQTWSRRPFFASTRPSIGAARRPRWAASLGPIVASSLALVGAVLSQRPSCETGSKEHEGQVVPLVCDRTEASYRKAGVSHVVLVHGLDSWRGTWARAADELQRRGVPSLAVDLRGHGESPLGRPADFGPEQLAADVRGAVLAAGLLAKPGDRIVLVGHSMGGRVAMRYAADYPDDLAALVIEDMDCVMRKPSPLSGSELRSREKFSRKFQTWEQCSSELMSFGYDRKRVDGWLQEGRVFPVDGGGFWSAINPHAQHLARVTVLQTNDGYEAMYRLAASRALGLADFPVLMFVAGPKGTVCSWDAQPGGVREMASIVPGLSTREFAEAGHSIHNSPSSQAAFADAVARLAKGSCERCDAGICSVHD